MAHHQAASVIDIAGASLLLLWAMAMWAAVAVLAYANRRTVRPWIFRGSAAVIILGIVGQLGHIQEHVAQTGYWVMHSGQQPWMTPWGDGLAAGFAGADPGKPSLGMEILHLIGNFIFLAGIAGVMIITRHALGSRARRWARMGVWMQGIHGLEHLALTLSVALGASQAIGLSTWFGVLEPGPGLWTYRIWWHFLANVLGSVIFAVALVHLWRERRHVAATFDVGSHAPASPSGWRLADPSDPSDQSDPSDPSGRGATVGAGAGGRTPA
ncbi:DUF6008 family protein [Mangrovihabitans endophyticus]|uniref:Uncharacterized protein n=1 Tax=Mangrovihabitans endophyticus TaxID=1751298 RepID=A0A8J3FLB7_9ACTN|nr:DUF6008 family protein [Mangrovihabitans endophyticus]GGK76976.1 hypothetical protein GCM10012284_08660 [Mangrovihabitans endophyticus]